MTMNPQVSPARLAALPAAAQRWLARALPEDAQLVTRVQVDQKGEMEIRGRWTPFTARGVYQAPPLSFTWQARLNMLPGVWILAEDGHKDGQGWGGARLWGLIPMGKRSAPEVLRSQLVRNLAELVWTPALALADPALVWRAAGDNAFEISAEQGGQPAVVRFDLDAQGDIVRAASPARPYDVPDGYAEAPWAYEFSDPRDFGGVRAPAQAAGAFEKPAGRWEYMHLHVTGVN